MAQKDVHDLARKGRPACGGVEIDESDFGPMLVPRCAVAASPARS